ncbi:MAG: CBS domain-containing protein [Actinomycetota bacterium]|nr:CBS domain-containing protein [Actinomycetota bacterium]
MIYLSQMLGKPVVDSTGADIGSISDVAIATGEIFPRVTSLAFQGPDKTPFMLSWRKFVADFDGESITLNVARPDMRFSYLQPDEVLLHRDLLNQQIVDTQGMKVVRVNDLKLSESRNQLRLLGAEVGMRGILRGIHPLLERAVAGVLRLVGGELQENLIAWNYMDLLDRDLSHVQLSVTHKRLHELHPADVADILEKLSATQRARVFEHLDNPQAAEAISELEDDLQADVIDDLGNQRASAILGMMDPDDAADVIGDLPYDKAETLLRLMGVREARAIRSLLGYKEKTAGGIMTPEVTTVAEEMTVQQVIEFLRGEAAEHESIYYIYVVEGDRHLAGVISLRDLIMSSPETRVEDILSRDVITVDADDDQELVAETMSKYDLLALPVLDETGKLLGIVTVDDALEVLEEESAEDLELATGRRRSVTEHGAWQWVSRNGWLVAWSALFVIIAVAIGTQGAEDLAVFLVAAAIPAVVMMRLAEDIASHTMSRVIEPEDEDDRTPLARRVVTDGLSGLAVGLVLGLVAATVVALVLRNSGGELAVTLEIAGLFGGLFGLATLVLALAGTLVGEMAERRYHAGKRVSNTAVSMALMAIGAAAFIGVFLALFPIFGQLIGQAG